MAKKKTYYDISNLLKTKAQYMMLLGQRANGKSYQVKKTVLENYINNKCKFIYLRRWQRDNKTKAIESYFGDMPIHKMTNGEYDTIQAWNEEIYLSKIDENGKLIKGDVIGRYCNLNEHERYKSQTFIDYDYIIYEEFITDNAYLYNEPTQLQQFVSTVFRHESGTVFLVGNTLTRVCPYFSEWCLDGVLKQKIGTIDIYRYHLENDTIVQIAVEYCANANYDNTMFFGQTARQIVSGVWDTKEVPHLPRHQLDYEVVYEIKVKFQSFAFILQLLVEPVDGGIITFVYPFTGTRNIYRIISDEFSDLPNITPFLDRNIKPEFLILKCINDNKICYSDNLTGADFNRILQEHKIIL